MASPDLAPSDDFRDVDIAIAQVVDDKGNPVGPAERVTARGLLNKAKSTFEPYERPAWDHATLNERFLNGQQWGGWNFKSNELVFDDWPAFLPRINRNVLRNLHLTWQARVTTKDPSVKAWGGESSRNDVGAAAVANQLIVAWRQQQDHRRMISRAAWTCGAQGCVAFWPYWDTIKGPKDETGKPQGDICVEPLSVFDWGTDGSENAEDSDYCYVRRWLPEETAREMLLRAGITDPPNEMPAQSIWGATRQLVECYYYYHKKTPRIPGGFYAIHVGGHVVESGDFPYDHNELPLIIWKCNDKPDSPHGGTHVDDAVPLQSALNRLHASLAKRTVLTSQWCKVIGSPEIIQLWDGAEQKIECKDPAAIQSLRIVEPGPVPAQVWTQIEELERMISVVFGINEAVVGSDYSQSKNARMLAYISELDAQKFAPTIAARDHALMRMYRQMLMLCQQFVVLPRTVRLIGEMGTPEILQFYGADLKGVDVYLEPAPGVEQGKTATAAAVEADALSGMEDPARAKELRETGQTVTGIERLTRRLVGMQAKQAAAGYQVQPDPTVVPMVAIEVLLDALEANESKPPEALAPLQQLLEAYRQMAAQQMQPAPPAGGAPQPAPQQPPEGGLIE